MLVGLCSRDLGPGHPKGDPVPHSWPLCLPSSTREDHDRSSQSPAGSRFIPAWWALPTAEPPVSREPLRPTPPTADGRRLLPVHGIPAEARPSMDKRGPQWLHQGQSVHLDAGGNRGKGLPQKRLWHGRCFLGVCACCCLRVLLGNLGLCSEAQFLWKGDGLLVPAPVAGLQSGAGEVFL